MRENKKNQIIKTAMKLFVNQGFENTPTAQISKEANVATGTLFYHYKTKEDLINEIYLTVKKSMKKEIFVNINFKNDFKILTENIWKSLIKWGFENKLENKFIVKFHGSSYISNLTIEQLQEDFEKGQKLFEKGIKEKKIKNLSCDLLQGITFSLYQSFLMEFYNVGKLDKKLLEKSFEVYWDAIKL